MGGSPRQGGSECARAFQARPESRVLKPGLPALSRETGWARAGQGGGEGLVPAGSDGVEPRETGWGGHAANGGEGTAGPGVCFVEARTLPPAFAPGKADVTSGNSECPGAEQQLDGVERPRARTRGLRSFRKLGGEPRNTYLFYIHVEGGDDKRRSVEKHDVVCPLKSERTDDDGPERGRLDHSLDRRRPRT